MGLKTQNTLGSRVYDLSNFGGCSVFDRVRGVNRRKIARKETPDASEVVLLQDLEFPISSQCVKVSPDGNFVVATGVYAPEVGARVEEGWGRFCFLSCQRRPVGMYEVRSRQVYAARSRLFRSASLMSTPSG